MLEKPKLADKDLIMCLQTAFTMDIASVEFLPIGSDIDSAVYRAVATDGRSYFVKLRRGDPTGLLVRIPQALSDRGVDGVIAPIPTTSGKLWTQLHEFNVSVAPFIEGQNGFNHDLTDDLWTALGRALKSLHTARLPADLRKELPRETFPNIWRDKVRGFQKLTVDADLPDDIARRLVRLMDDQRESIDQVVTSAARHACELRSRELTMVPCHADIHGGNVLIDQGGNIHIVDWDTFMLAPKERDLMFIGGGIGRGWGRECPQQSFYDGYGSVEADPTIIAYYRCERIVEDFAAFGAQIFLTSEGGEDREQSLHYFASNFDPGGTIDIAIDSVRRAHR
jgi:spectinomycin phosphotransferase